MEKVCAESRPSTVAFSWVHRGKARRIVFGKRALYMPRECSNSMRSAGRPTVDASPCGNEACNTEPGPFQGLGLGQRRCPIRLWL